MKIIIPKKLQKGDKIGIVSPSNPVTEIWEIQLESGIRVLKEDFGLDVLLAPNALKNTLGYSATPEEKAEDINAMLADKSIKAIVCSQGGANANSVLPFLDYDLIRSNPKIFLGISDITVLLNAIYHKTGLVTFHGNDVMWGFGRKHELYDEDEFRIRLMEGRTEIINKNSEWKCIRKGKTEGTLIGGNLNCMNKLIGTEFMPCFEGNILFLEDFGEEGDSAEVHCLLYHLKQIGVFEQISGLWLGHYKNKLDVQFEDIALDVLKSYDFPILKCDDFGHNCPNTTLPVGAKVRLDADRQEVVILESCVL